LRQKSQAKSSKILAVKEGKLYKRLYTSPYLLCVHPKAIKLLLEELHDETCGSHTGGQTLAHWAIIQGY